MLVEWWLTDGKEPLPLPSATGAAPAAPTPLGSAQSLRCACLPALQGLQLQRDRLI